MQVAHDPVGHAGDLLPPEDADHLVDLRHLVQQHLALPFRQAPCDDHSLELARPLAVEHLANDPQRLQPRGVDEPAGIDDHHVRLLAVGDEHVAVLGQEAEHALGVNEVLRTAEADEGESSLHGGLIVHRFEAHEEAGASRWEIASMSIRDTLCHSSKTSG